MRQARVILAVLLAGAAAVAAAAVVAADVVVLRGGLRIELKTPLVQQGNNALLTRADGTLLSVPLTEIDWKATNAARASGPVVAKPAVVLPPSTPADAVRTGRQEKARVRVTDADVGHAEAAPAPGEKEKGVETRAGAGRVEIGDYTQQKAGTNLMVTGSLRNPGTTAVTNTHLTVSAIDEAGNAVSTGNATLATGTIEGGRSVTFAATLPIGDRTVNQVRFSPMWQTPPPPPPPPAAAGAPAGTSAAASAAAPASTAGAPAAKPPAPAPTPYGQGSLYAAPAPSAPSVPPADGKTGYIPGAASPENQPKPPQ
ncbi:MAG: FxLYD domain-containing protein [Acidobacteriota bacterium]